MKRVAQACLVMGLTLGSVFPVHAAREALDKVVAVVNKEALMQTELDTRMDSVYQNLRQRNITPPPREQLRQQVLDRLILDTVQIQQANLSGIKVDEQQLASAIASVARQNKMTTAQFRRLLERQGLPFSVVQEQIGRELLINELRQRRVGQRIHISDQEVDIFLSQQKSELNSTDYHLQQITLNLPDKATPQQVAEVESKARKAYQQLIDGEDFAQLAIRISDDDFALEGGDSGWRRGSELPVLIADQALVLDINELTQPLRSPTGFHIVKLLEKRGGLSKLITETQARHILISPTALRTEAEARKLISSLRERVKNGEDFAELASNYSDDKGSAGDGGSLGWAGPGKFVPEFETAMNNTPVDGISPVFRSPFGFHIIQVNGRRSQDIGRQVLLDQARQQLYKRKFDTELENWLREIRSAAYVEIR
ncbi:peptidylprolyl isomerase [Oceanospirillum sediminis]|uniref:Chaperone SurA n=1 Tax=Oceanospirillum sediminis TaxID=2760088 RepID=A0A839IT00_9GAMM|nr:peptidylprolyl isomerase [Oceanospirillum sediminis]MBB1488445.1 peptidylprolyl isomerase [Oceanospirillum sediminis]